MRSATIAASAIASAVAAATRESDHTGAAAGRGRAALSDCLVQPRPRMRQCHPLDVVSDCDRGSEAQQQAVDLVHALLLGSGSGASRDSVSWADTVSRAR